MGVMVGGAVGGGTVGDGTGCSMQAVSVRDSSKHGAAIKRFIFGVPLYAGIWNGAA